MKVPKISFIAFPILFIYFFVGTSIGYSKPLKFFVEQAQKHSPLLKEARYQAQGAKASADEVSVFRKNPEISLSQQNVPLGSWPALDQHAMSGVSFGVSQSLGFPWETHWRKSRAKADARASRHQADLQHRDLFVRIALAYHKLHYIAYRIEILQDSQEAFRKILELSRSLVSVDKMNSSQLLKIKADLLEVGNNILTEKGNLAQLREQMEFLVGKKFSIDLDKKAVEKWRQSVDKSLPQKFDPHTHPAWRMAQERYQARKAALSLERARLAPSVKLGANYTLRREVPGGSKGEDFVSVRAAMPIPLYYPIKERHSIQKQKMRLNQAEQKRKNIANRLRYEWRGEQSKLIKIKRAYASYKEQILPNYKAVYQSQLSSLPSGTITLIDVLDSYRKYLSGKERAAKMFLDLQMSRTKLVGLLTSDFSRYYE